MSIKSAGNEIPVRETSMLKIYKNTFSLAILLLCINLADTYTSRDFVHLMK